MNDLTLYTKLLKGANIGSLSFANSLATTYSKMIENGDILPQNRLNIYGELIGFYGTMMEESEEKDLENLLQNADNQKTVSHLKLLDANYTDYFLELISERRERIEIIYEDVSKRIKIAMIDDEITEIKKAESLSDFTLAGEIWKKIAKNENIAIQELKHETQKSLVNYMAKNSGNEEDAKDIWAEAQSEFRKILGKLPHESGFYQWQSSNDKDEKTASIKTFFFRICKMRWLDELRRLKRIDNKQGNIIKRYYEPIEEDSLNEKHEKEYISRQVRFAITKLQAKCQKIIIPKWFGGKNGEVLSSKELSSAIGYAVGTIDNNYKNCLQELKTIWNNINLNNYDTR